MKSEDFRRWMTLLENTPRTLYHGTLKRYLPSILQNGLEPRVGEFTRNAYDEIEAAGIELPELVFAADKNGLRRCVSAIMGQMRQLGLKTDEETFYRNAVLLVIREGGSHMDLRAQDDSEVDDWGDTFPDTVEPGDYYSDDVVAVDHILTGNKLKAFLARHNERLWDESVATKRERLIRLALRQHSEFPRDVVLAKVREVPDDEVGKRLRWYEQNASGR